MKPGQPTTHTYDYKHYGTTTLFADLNVLEGKVISRRMQRRRNQKLIRFLNHGPGCSSGGQNRPRDHDNYAVHKHPKVRAWLERHPRLYLSLQPTSASWFNAVEGFFAKLAKRRLRRGVFESWPAPNAPPKSNRGWKLCL